TRLVEASQAIITSGCTLSDSFTRSGIFPEFLLSMIAVGEESGKLEESLDQIASSYEKEVDQAIKIMVSMVEPLLIISVGGVVGFIVFAMLLPILNMGGMGQ
ncbi:MAG: type II secretion system F family protein, partial [Candidatus Omnitrophota bacterium]